MCTHRRARTYGGTCPEIVVLRARAPILICFLQPFVIEALDLCRCLAYLSACGRYLQLYMY